MRKRCIGIAMALLLGITSLPLSVFGETISEDGQILESFGDETDVEQEELQIPESTEDSESQNDTDTQEEVQEETGDLPEEGDVGLDLGFTSDGGEGQFFSSQGETFTREESDAQEDNEWTRYQNSVENNGVVSVLTPQMEEKTNMRWASRLGEGYSESFTPPLILDGSLYVLRGNQIVKVSKENGTVMAESEPLEGTGGYALNPLTYGDGMIFAAIGDGRVQAVDAVSLKSVWVSESLGGQTLSPIAYRDGYIYTGTWVSEKEDGQYFCLSVADEDPSQETEEKKALWKLSHKGGFYWAGAYVEEGTDGKEYVIFGSDDGSEANGSSVLYSVDADTGEVVSQLTGFVGDIRSSIAYDGGKVYFTTKGGYLYRASLQNGELGDAVGIDLEGMATATPVVYNGRIYVGVCGKGNQFEGDAGHHMDVLEDGASGITLAYSSEVPGYPQAAAILSDAYVSRDYDGDSQADGRVYVYFTYNVGPGGIYYLTDEPGQKKGNAKDLFVPPVGKRQYCISPLCVDKDGTIYYKNDSGYLMAVEQMGAYLEGSNAQADVGEVHWNQEFNGGTKEYVLTVDEAASTVTLNFVIPEGQTATVNGEPTDGNCVLTLDENKEATAEVEVSDGERSAQYVFQVKTVRSSALLSGLSVAREDGAEIAYNPEFQGDTKEYTSLIQQNLDTFTVIPEKVHEGEQIQAESVEGIQEIKTEEKQGTLKFQVTFADGADTATLRLNVEAANGRESGEYLLTVLRKLKSEAVQAVEAQIAQIGTVTIDSESEVASARQAYEQLTEEEKASVGNYQLLTEAEQELAQIKEKRETFCAGMPKVTAKSVSYNSIQISWESYEDAKSYYVYRKTAGKSFQRIAWVKDLTDLSYTDHTAVTGTTYYYTVKAASDSWGAPVYSKYVTNLKAQAVPQRSVIQKVQTWGYNAVKVTWDKVSGASGYRLYYKTSPNGTYHYVTQIGSGSTTSYVHTGRTTGQTYYYLMRAYRTVNGKQVFGSYSAMVSGKAVPKKTVITKAVAGSRKVTLTWNKVSGASGYRIYYKTSEDGAWNYVTQVGKGTTVSYVHSGLKKGQTYYYTMRAYRTVNGQKVFGAYSDWKTVKAK